jgi:hypothetical protein
MRRAPLGLTALILVIALAACGAGGSHPAATASHAGQTGGGSTGRPIHVSPGWRIAQALPSEPGSGQPGGGYTDMLSVAAAGARDAWAVGDICPQPGGARCDSLLVEHWAGARWRTIPSPPGRRASIPPTVISASSATNAWVFADTADLTTRASRWNGSSWTSFSFPPDLRTTAAAVFSRTDAWAFGELFAGEIRKYSQPYVVRFNGRRWLRMPSPLVPQAASAVAPDDIWTVGTLTGPGEVWAAAHWNGSSWRTLQFPPLPPAVRRRAEIGNAAIEAFSARDAWVDIGLTTATASYGAIVLHWNGRAWSRVPVPYRTQTAGDISQDGHGGIWMYAIGPASAAGAPAYLYHYSEGQWSRQRAPALDSQATEMGVLSWSPGARWGWAAAGTGTRGLLLRYFP